MKPTEKQIEKSQAQLEYDKKAQTVALKLGDIETIMLLSELALLDSSVKNKDGKVAFSRGIFEQGADTRNLDINGIAIKHVKGEAKMEIIRDIIQTLSDALSPKEEKKAKEKLTKKESDNLTGDYV